MNSLLVASAVAILLVCLTEYTMWNMFKKRVAGLHFPREADVSHLRFFSMRRLQLCALIHTCGVIGVILLFLLWTW